MRFHTSEADTPIHVSGDCIPLYSSEDDIPPHSSEDDIPLDPAENDMGVIKIGPGTPGSSNFPSICDHFFSSQAQGSAGMAQRTTFR